MDMPMSNSTSNNDMMMPMEMVMQMSFYWGKHAIVLFPGWPNNSVGMYILAIFFVFILAAATEILSNMPPLIKRGSNPFKGGLILEACIYFFRTGLAYLVMLSVMSFNVGIFVAAVAGHSLGFFIARSRSIAIANKKDQGASSVTIGV